MKQHISIYLPPEVNFELKTLAAKRSMKKAQSKDYKLPVNASTIIERALELYFKSAEGKK